jgi:RNA polymerase sigma factor (sigma-70 family)
MNAGPKKALERLCRSLQDASLSDAQLLRRFTASRDEDAFSALVRRHGPMVLGLCRRILRDEHDAEDAFQAVFLILARKAASVQQQDAVACWLHRVAYRVSVSGRSINRRRRARERLLEHLPHPTVEPEPPRDWQAVLDEELLRLPERYRCAVLLCDLEGRTRKEAARRLGLPEGTLSGRLTTARRRLADRLARRGVGLPNAPLAPPVPSLLEATTNAAATAAAGPLAASNAAVLATGVLQAMFFAKVKVAAVVLAAALAVGGLTYRALPGAARAQDAPAQQPKADKPPNDVEALRKKVELLELNLQVLLEKVRAQELQIQALKKELAARGKTGGPPVPQNAPRVEVKGKVSRVDGKLVVIDIGVDAGLLRGHTLEVYRLGKNPKYVGRIKIIEVTAKEAVGQATGRMAAAVEVGDEVAARALPR